MRSNVPRTLALPALLLPALALAILLAPLTALAEPPENERDEAREGDGKHHSEMVEKIRMMRMYALTEALDLNEETAAKLFPYLRDQDRALMKLHEAKREHHKAFRKMVKEDNYDEKAVDRRIAELYQLDEKIALALQNQMMGLKHILSVEQRTKFVMVHARFEEKVHAMIKEERKRRREQRRERRGQGGPGRAHGERP